MRYLLLLLCSLFALTACNKEDEYKPLNRTVFWNPSFIFVNEQGDNLFEKSVYKENQLSLIVTDEKGEPLLNANGQRIEDMEGTAEVLDVIRTTDGQAMGARLGLGYSYSKEGNTVTSYYKLKYDIDKYDTIKVIADAPNYDFVIKEIYYNNTHYMITDDTTIKVIKQE